MGGLVIKWCVLKALKNAPDLIRQIVTIATPYQGSLKAIEMLVAGTPSFFGMFTWRAERRAARTMPGVYQLLPSYDKGLVDALGLGHHAAMPEYDEVQTWITNDVLKSGAARTFSSYGYSSIG